MAYSARPTTPFELTSFRIIRAKTHFENGKYGRAGQALKRALDHHKIATATCISLVEGLKLYAELYTGYHLDLLTSDNPGHNQLVKKVIRDEFLRPLDKAFSQMEYQGIGLLLPAEPAGKNRQEHTSTRLSHFFFTEPTGETSTPFTFLFRALLSYTAGRSLACNRNLARYFGKSLEETKEESTIAGFASLAKTYFPSLLDPTHPLCQLFFIGELIPASAQSAEAKEETQEALASAKTAYVELWSHFITKSTQHAVIDHLRLGLSANESDISQVVENLEAKKNTSPPKHVLYTFIPTLKKSLSEANLLSQSEQKSQTPRPRTALSFHRNRKTTASHKVPSQGTTGQRHL